MFSETDIINMLEFLIDNIIDMSHGRFFQQSRHCHWIKLRSSGLAYLFHYSHVADSIQGLYKENERKLALT
jgi:CO dehydrogenase/acetyl-CoA synthase beta subunit